MSDRPGLRRPAGWAWLGGTPLIWAAFAVGVVAGGYLLISAAVRRGPEVTITFATADGVKTGTKVEHKAVTLGTVTAIGVADDLSGVVVHVRMTSDAEPYLTDKARFWVVRPQLSGGSITNLTTLLSGNFIEMDPGQSPAPRRTDFAGLATPPANRSGIVGTTFLLHAPTVSGLASGTQIFYRDIAVGEVLDNHVAEGTAAVTADIFVRAPYDQRVRTGSVFWELPGITTTIADRGVHLDVQSIQAVLSGGLAFNTPPDAGDYPQAKPGTTYPLFTSEAVAVNAAYDRRIPYILYFHGAAAGLTVGSPVQLFGLQVGVVSGTRAQADAATGAAEVRVAIDVLPQRLHVLGSDPNEDLGTVTRRLVAGGLRGELATTSYVTQAQAVALAFDPATPPGTVTMEAGVMVLPVKEGAGGGALASAPAMLGKLQAIPYESLGRTVDASLGALAAALGGRTAGKPVADLTASLVNLQAMVRRTDASLGPALASLPAEADAFGQILAQANKALRSADLRYGSGSDGAEGLDRMIARYTDTARYSRLLADYLSRHPEAVVHGNTSLGSER